MVKLTIMAISLLTILNVFGQKTQITPPSESSNAKNKTGNNKSAKVENSKQKINSVDTIKILNNSFEKTPLLADMDWFDCSFVGESPVSIMPTDVVKFINFDKQIKAVDGGQYILMLTKDNNKWEGLSQRLSTPLAQNSTYEISLFLANLPDCSLNSGTANKIVNYSTPTVLRIWGGANYCGKKELLAESKAINHKEWKEYKFTLKPTMNTSHIVFEAFYDRTKRLVQPENGNLLLDKISDIVLVSQEKNTPPPLLKEWAIEPQFDKILKISNENIAFVKKGNKWGIVDDSGYELSAPQFDSIGFLAENYARIFMNKRQGVFSYHGERVCVQPEYDDIAMPYWGSTGIVAIKKGELWGLIDTNKQIVVPCKYKEELNVYKNVWYFENKNQRDTVYVVPKSESNRNKYQPKQYVFKNAPIPLSRNPNPEPERPRRMYESSRLRKEDKEDKEDIKEVVKEAITIPEPPLAVSPPRVKEFFIRHLDIGGSELLDSDEKPIFDYPLRAIHEFGARFFLLQKEENGKLALWDMETQTFKTDYIYFTIMLYSPSTLYLFKRDGKAGFMNDEGEEVIPPIYDDGYIYMSYVSVIKDGKIGLMNRKNDWFLPLEYDNINLLSDENGAWVRINGKWGLMRFYPR
jgi:hypothetical protein